MASYSIYIIFALVIFTGTGSPVKQSEPENIRSMILPAQNGNAFVPHGVREVVITPTSNQAAGIVRSQLGYIQVARVGSGLSLPPIPGINFKTFLNGSITHRGFKASNIEIFIKRRASQYSSSLRKFIDIETKASKRRAKKGFFWFYQSAANYGYSKTNGTETTLFDDDFRSLSNDTNRVLNQTDERILTASYSTEFSGTTTNVGGVLQAFAYIYINRITLDSGKIFDVVKENPELTVADQNGSVMGNTEPGAVAVTSSGGNIGDSILDSTLPTEPDERSFYVGGSDIDKNALTDNASS